MSDIGCRKLDRGLGELRSNPNLIRRIRRLSATEESQLLDEEVDLVLRVVDVWRDTNDAGEASVGHVDGGRVACGNRHVDGALAQMVPDRARILAVHRERDDASKHRTAVLHHNTWEAAELIPRVLCKAADSLPHSVDAESEGEIYASPHAEQCCVALLSGFEASGVVSCLEPIGKDLLAVKHLHGRVLHPVAVAIAHVEEPPTPRSAQPFP